MSFIQVQQSLVTHRKTLRLARLLSLDRYAVIGRLVALWSWCLDNALDGALGDDIDADVLADVMAFDSSMGKPADLLEALLTAGFLDLDDESNPGYPVLRIHDWHEHMGRLIEKRAADAERHRLSRAAQAKARSAAAPIAAPSAAADVSAPDETGDDEDVMRMSCGRHADVMRQSRVEKNRVTTKGQGDPSSERDAGTRQARALSRASPASTSPTSTSPRTPTTTGARVPDVVWDACIAAMGSPPSNSVERGKWAKGIKALKESLLDGLPPNEQSGITAQMAAEIGVRCLRYRKRFGTSVPLNPMALAGNWSALATDIAPLKPLEGQRHGNFTTRPTGQRQYSATAGRSGGRGSRAGGRPAIGTAEYYAQAAASPGASNTARDGGGASREGGAAAATLAIG